MKRYDVRLPNPFSLPLQQFLLSLKAKISKSKTLEASSSLLSPFIEAVSLDGWVIPSYHTILECIFVYYSETISVMEPGSSGLKEDGGKLFPGSLQEMLRRSQAQRRLPEVSPYRPVITCAFFTLVGNEPGRWKYFLV